MASILYEGHPYTVLENESVLDALLRNGHKVAHSCRAGSCGSCLMRASAGPVPANAQDGMKDSWKARGYFHACVCRPAADLEVAPVGEDARSGATITGLALLSADVLQVRLRTDSPLEFRVGQYVTIVREDGLARSYSIASLPEDGDLELHVRRIPGGRMSGWLHSGARPGDRVSVIGPSGECFYTEGREGQPLLLAGTGTGLAPLVGIVRDALSKGHTGPIHLFHGALHEAGLYLVEELRRLVRQHGQLEYTPSVLQGSESDGIATGPIDQVVLKRFPKLSGWRGFVCGDPALVRALKKKLFLSGMASRDIYADAFLPAAPSS
jgi:CDP-4-dehydro-6-deoxyglucose reductase, E3